MCLIKKIKRNAKRILTGHPSCGKTPLAKKNFWNVVLIVSVENVPRVEEYCFIGTRTEAVHYATINALEKHNYNCKILRWFKVSRA